MGSILWIIWKMHSRSMMSEIRKDPFSGALVIYSPGRENRPDFTGIKKSIELSPENCPFCSGNEDMTPPEIYRIGDNSGWKVRVVPNKFPVLNVEENFNRDNEGILEKFTGAGAHEIIIETPSHSEDISKSGPEYFKNIFTTYRDRINDLKKDFRFKYIQVFKNHKAPAGATISHNHSQLIALPFVPAEVKNKLSVLKTYHKKHNRSLFDEVISKELESGKRVIYENNGFLAVAPWYSRSPFQISIFGKDGHPRFEDINDKELDGLSDIFAVVIKKLVAALGDPPMNIMLNNAPFDKEADQSFKWNVDIFPVLGGTGGFEAATGTYINSVLPEKAASILKKY
ncbi:MAG: DUF4931 domain-containing protein [Acidobacteriota bacterium]